jgi:hypothetical protein
MLWIIVALLVLLLVLSGIVHGVSHLEHHKVIENHAVEILEAKKEAFDIGYDVGIIEGIQRGRYQVLQEEYNRIQARRGNTDYSETPTKGRST